MNVPTTNIQHCSQDQVWSFCLSKHFTRRHCQSWSLDAFFPSEAENSRPHSEPPGMCCLCESDDARSDSLRRFRVLDGPTLLRDRLCHQNGWILGRLPKRGSVFNPTYVADFGPSNRAFWAWNYEKIATWFSGNERMDQRPFGTFPKIHPFWGRHLPPLVWCCS